MLTIALCGSMAHSSFCCTWAAPAPLHRSHRMVLPLMLAGGQASLQRSASKAAGAAAAAAAGAAAAAQREGAQAGQLPGRHGPALQQRGERGRGALHAPVRRRGQGPRAQLHGAPCVSPAGPACTPALRAPSDRPVALLTGPASGRIIAVLFLQPICRELLLAEPTGQQCMCMHAGRQRHQECWAFHKCWAGSWLVEGSAACMAGDRTALGRASWHRRCAA